MKLLIIDNAEPADKAFNDALIRAVLGLAECDVVNCREIPDHSNLIDAYAGVILSGVPVHYSFESTEERMRYFDWIRETELPVFGICLAHQAIGKMFGAEFIYNDEAEEGIIPIKMVADDPIFGGFGAEFEAYALHRASITVPDDFILLASSATCKNQIMKHKTKPIYGFQFHPELSPGGEQFLQNFIDLSMVALPKP